MASEKKKRLDSDDNSDTMYIHCLDRCLMEKDVQFAFRVEAQLREQFVRTCKGIDRSAGQILREFMREFVRDNVQASLFDAAANQNNNQTRI